MKEMVKKIGQLIEKIAGTKGEISFCALALREESVVWDLLIAAQWIDDEQRQAIDYMAKEVQQTLTKSELLQLSGIVVLQNKFFTGKPIFRGEMGWEEHDITLYGIPVKKVFVLIASDTELQMLSGEEKSVLP